MIGGTNEWLGGTAERHTVTTVCGHSIPWLHTMRRLNPVLWYDTCVFCTIHIVILSIRMSSYSYFRIERNNSLKKYDRTTFVYRAIGLPSNLLQEYQNCITILPCATATGESTYILHSGANQLVQGFIAFSLNSHIVNGNVLQVYWEIAQSAPEFLVIFQTPSYLLRESRNQSYRGSLHFPASTLRHVDTRNVDRKTGGCHLSKT